MPSYPPRNYVVNNANTVSLMNSRLTSFYNYVVNNYVVNTLRGHKAIKAINQSNANGYPTSTTETSSYFMLLCVQQNQQSMFDAIWQDMIGREYSQAHANQLDTQIRIWEWNLNTDAPATGVNATAEDGDAVLALALILGGIKWGNNTYITNGVEIAECLYAMNRTDRYGKYIFSTGGSNFQDDASQVNADIAYQVLPLAYLMTKLSAHNSAGWAKVISDTITVIQDNINVINGLGIPFNQGAISKITDNGYAAQVCLNTGISNPNGFDFEGSRIAYNMLMYWLMSRDHQIFDFATTNNKILNDIRNNPKLTGATIWTGYNQDGSTETTSHYPLMSAFAIAMSAIVNGNSGETEALIYQLLESIWNTSGYWNEYPSYQNTTPTAPGDLFSQFQVALVLIAICIGGPVSIPTGTWQTVIDPFSFGTPVVYFNPALSYNTMASGNTKYSQLNNQIKANIGAGTVAINHTTGAVTGTGTNFASTDVGKKIVTSDGQVGTITAWTSTTSITVSGFTVDVTAGTTYLIPKLFTRAGTITTNGSTTAIIGTGTDFNQTDVGAVIVTSGGHAITISSVTNATTATATAVPAAETNATIQISKLREIHQSTGASQPTYSSNGMNGKPCFVLNGSSTEMHSLHGPICDILSNTNGATFLLSFSTNVQTTVGNQQLLQILLSGGQTMINIFIDGQSNGTGTITVNQNSNVVTGSGTSFLSLQAGAFITTAGGQKHQIKSITNNTTLTTVDNFTGNEGPVSFFYSDAKYTIDIRRSSSDVSAGVTQSQVRHHDGVNIDLRVEIDFITGVVRIFRDNILIVEGLYTINVPSTGQTDTNDGTSTSAIFRLWNDGGSNWFYGNHGPVLIIKDTGNKTLTWQQRSAINYWLNTTLGYALYT